MKLGLVSAILPDYSLDQIFDLCQQENLETVEVMCWPEGKAERRYAGVSHIDVDHLTNEMLLKILTKQQRSGVSISALGYYPNPLDPDLAVRERAIEHLKKLIVAAQSLNIGMVTTFIGRDQWKSYQENLILFEKIWPELIAWAEKHDVKIAIENCPMLFSQDEWPGGKNLATTPAIWQDLFDRIPSPNFGLNFDPSHFIWQQMDYIKPVYDFADKLFHIHFKDIRVNPYQLNQVGTMATPLAYSAPKLPGLGDVDWGRFVAALTDINYEGAATIEIEDKAYEATLQDRLRAIRQSTLYMRGFVGPTS
ncbi:MAG: sugar phosphate isomerase/epimerase [Eubacteriales bacterium]|nr:sugar phosphate isomerase/epimerase [Eubacteriales bacterium]